LNGLRAMEPAEAVYPSAEADNRGDFLNGERRYSLHIPVGGIPVDAFWSLSMYALMPDGRLFFPIIRSSAMLLGIAPGGEEECRWQHGYSDPAWFPRQRQ
jgi:hypothetical protein